MHIGIIGSGKMGSVLARLLARAGHDVRVANSRGLESLRDVVPRLGERVRATDVHSAVQASELVFLGVPYLAVERVAREGAPWADKVVVDVTNFYPGRDGEAFDPAPASSSRVVARLVETAIVVKAFNTIMWRDLEAQGRPAGEPGRRAIPVAADNADAKHLVMSLVDEIGFEPVDAGTLDDSWRQEPGTAVSGGQLDAEGVRQALGTASRASSG